ncbi:MAG: TIGR04211 family SH3 domain-containing protein, partial [Pseudomonadota bacterium]
LSSDGLTQSRYVTDDFEIMFRSGPSVQNKIIRPLRSGTQIEILRDDVGNGHSQIQTIEGEIGYVLTRFVSESPPARSQLALLQSQLSELRADPNDMRSKLANAQEENQLLINENMKLSTSLKQSQDRLGEFRNASGNTVELTEQNQKLTDEVQQLLLQLDDFRIQNEALKDTSQQKTMLWTFAIMVAGLFLGWVLSMAGRRRSTHARW